MAKRPPLKVPALDPALGPDDLAPLLAEIGALQRQEATMIARADAAKAKIDTGLAETLVPLRTALDAKAAVAVALADKHRDSLVRKGTKTAFLATGEISWRLAPPRVVLRGVKEVVARLTSLGLTQFLRQKVEVDKEAILADPDRATAVEGISLGGGHEEVVLKPHQTAIEPVELARRVT